MWSSEEIFVLSDLHLAAENGEGLFQADGDLASCLNWIRSESSSSTVVLAGDVLDYLVITEGETASDVEDFRRVGQRTEAIVAHHPEVFSALASLIGSGHHLVVIGGNHDPELVFPEAQMCIERRIRVAFANPVIRWLVHGEALRLKVGEAVVSIEHGEILDNWNRIDHDALRSALSLASRNLTDKHDYHAPPGSRLILEATMELRGSFRWVDYLKPEQEAVLPLIHHFASPKQRRLILRLIDDYLTMKVASFGAYVRRKRSVGRLYKSNEPLNTPREQAFRKWVAKLKNEERLTRGKRSQAGKFIETLRQISALDKFFEIDQEDELGKDLRVLFENGADLVICGHTHAAKAYRLGLGLYFNTGTWGQLLRLPMSYERDEVWQQFVDMLEANKADGFRRPTLAHVKHSVDESVTRAGLLEWKEGQPRSLSNWSFRGQGRGWQKEV